jgi:hypothetical protein
MAVSHSTATTSHDSDTIERRAGSEVGFRVGDQVRHGMQVGTVTDVGTVLVQLTTTPGASRVVCPWELVRVRPSREGRDRTRAEVSSRHAQCRR